MARASIPASRTPKKKGRSQDRPSVPIARNLRRSLPRERGHDADEDARFVVADVIRELLQATGIGARELREDREIARGVVALHRIVEDFVTVDVFPVVAPRVAGVE